MIVAIARELGAGGREVGERVAAALGAELLDNQIVDLVAAKIGAPASYVAAHDEKTETFVDRLFRAITAAYPEAYVGESVPDWSEERLVELTGGIIRERAECESLVVIGRGAPFLLRDRADMLRVFVHAPLETRLTRLCRHRGYSRDEALKAARASDQQRGEYLKQHFGVQWLDLRNYDLTIDTERLTIDEGARLVIEAARCVVGPQ